MKNKGFTLIELLSVIVVIAIVTLIAFPVISGVVEKTKLKALEDSAYGLVEASNLYYAQYANENTVRFDKNEDENTLKNLSYKGSIEKGTVIINNKGQVTVCISDGKNSAYKNYNENKVTAVAKKTCTVPSNTYVVYLDNDRTIQELSNQELTERLIALENSLIDKIYPVGSIYTSTCGGTTETECLKTPEEVATKFGGTWEVYGEGRVLQSSTGTSGSTGGSNNVTLSASNIPSLSVSGTTGSTGSGYSIGYGYSNRTTTGTSKTLTGDIFNFAVQNSTGGATGSGVFSQYYTSGEGVGYAVNTKTSSSGYVDRLRMDATHTHTYPDYYANSITGVAAHTHTFTGTYTNNSQAKVDVQNKYITVYMYKRIA